jgi:hypothetical protein
LPIPNHFAIFAIRLIQQVYASATWFQAGKKVAVQGPERCSGGDQGVSVCGARLVLERSV